MADELDDRLHELAQDAEQLVVLAGPQAARARGERRRARRRAAAAGTVTALALGVTCWQLLPRLEQADRARTTAPAASGSATPEPTISTQALTDRLLPTSSLPFAPKWRWTVADNGTKNDVPSSCGYPVPAGVIAQDGRTYMAEAVKAIAYERLLAFPDEPAAVAGAAELRQRIDAKCAMDIITVENGVWGRLVADRAMGSSKKISGVTVWIQHEGQYVAVLVVDSPHSPLQWEPGDEPDGPRPAGCLADTLDDLAMPPSPDAPSTVTSPGSGRAGGGTTRYFTVGGDAAGDTHVSGKDGSGADKGPYSSSADC
ncbi:hypothetical protein [Streptomyces sp. NPDC021224]|uniref:hypothetical protein n=1 Tax=unclassified Streptomyces TaxID=2593676 RepID=UPI00378FCF5E